MLSVGFEPTMPLIAGEYASWLVCWNPVAVVHCNDWINNSVRSLRKKWLNEATRIDYFSWIWHWRLISSCGPPPPIRYVRALLHLWMWHTVLRKYWTPIVLHSLACPLWLYSLNPSPLHGTTQQSGLRMRPPPPVRIFELCYAVWTGHVAQRISGTVSCTNKGHQLMTHACMGNFVKRSLNQFKL
jgi:hypothetical protein